jgi:hypothetical protein
MSGIKFCINQFNCIPMKKFYLTSIFVFFLLPLINAQFIKVGGGLALSSGSHFNQQTGNESKTGIIGLFVKGIYKINLPFQISPSITVNYPHITNDQLLRDKITISSIMLDINGHYIFNSLNKFEFYGLAGFDILFARRKDVYSGTVATNLGAATYKENDNALGLNLGAGTYIKVNDKFDVSAEAKYMLSKYHQFILNAGVLLNLDWMKKHENTDL